MNDNLSLMDQYKELELKNPNRIDVNRFEFLKVLGTGAFGAVFLVQSIDDGQFYAFKSLSKIHVIEKKQVDHVKNEIFILTCLNNQFIVKAYGFNQDRSYIHMIMEFVPGGEFFTYLRRLDQLSPQVAAFYSAQVVLAFEYLHSYRIAYRDLKPENLLIGANGYLKLGDFGFAKIVKDRTFTICGTPDYIAPEVLLNQGHNWSVDWWSLGVLIYEMISGMTPFEAGTPMEMYEKIVKLKYNFPKGFNQKAKSLITHLLQRDLAQRYGNLSKRSWDIKIHCFFDGIDWDDLSKGLITAPFVPQLEHPGDCSYFDHFDKPILETRTLKEEDDPFLLWQLIINSLINFVFLKSYFFLQNFQQYAVIKSHANVDLQSLQLKIE